MNAFVSGLAAGCLAGGLITWLVASRPGTDDERATVGGAGAEGTGVGPAGEAWEQVVEERMRSEARVHQVEQQNLELAVQVQGLLSEVTRLRERAARREREAVPSPVVVATNLAERAQAVERELGQMEGQLRVALWLRIMQELEDRMVVLKQTLRLTPDQEQVVRKNLLATLEEEMGWQPGWEVPVDALGRGVTPRVGGPGEVWDGEVPPLTDNGIEDHPEFDLDFDPEFDPEMDPDPDLEPAPF